MPGAKTTVGKGRIVNDADSILGAPTEELLDGLKNAVRLSDRALAVGVISPGDKPHVDTDWFGASWWPDYPAKEEIVKDAYIKAMELSLANAEPKPVVSYWLYGLERFEAMVAESDHQVTLFIITPSHPPVTLPPPTEALLEKLWIIAKEDRIAEIRDSYPPGYNMDQLIEPGFPTGIKRLRVKGY